MPGQTPGSPVGETASIWMWVPGPSRCSSFQFRTKASWRSLVSPLHDPRRRADEADDVARVVELRPLALGVGDGAVAVVADDGRDARRCWCGSPARRRPSRRSCRPATRLPSALWNDTTLPLALIPGRLLDVPAAKPSSATDTRRGGARVRAAGAPGARGRRRYTSRSVLVSWATSWRSEAKIRKLPSPEISGRRLSTSLPGFGFVGDLELAAAPRAPRRRRRCRTPDAVVGDEAGVVGDDRAGRIPSRVRAMALTGSVEHVTHEDPGPRRGRDRLEADRRERDVPPVAARSRRRSTRRWGWRRVDVTLTRRVTGADGFVKSTQ